MMYIKTVSLQECADIAHKNGYTMITGWDGYNSVTEIFDMEAGDLVAKGFIKDAIVTLVGNFALDAEIYDFVKVARHMITVTARDILDKLEGNFTLAYVNGEIHASLKPVDNHICSIHFESLDDTFNIRSDSALRPYFM